MIGRLRIDENDPCPSLLGKPGHPGSWINRRRGPHDKEDLTGHERIFSLQHLIFRKRFTEPDDRWPELPSSLPAMPLIRGLGVGWSIIRRAALETAFRDQIAMQLRDILGAGALMQTINVLRDHADTGVFLDLNDRTVARVRLTRECLRTAFGIPLQNLLWMPAKGLGRSEFHRIEASPEARLRLAECRDPALC